MEEKNSRGRRRQPLISAESFELAEENVEQVQFNLSDSTPDTPNTPEDNEESTAEAIPYAESIAENAEEDQDQDTDINDPLYSEGEDISEGTAPSSAEPHVEIFDNKSGHSHDDYEGDEAYVYNTDAFWDKDIIGIEGSVNKRSGLSHYIHGSLIIHLIRSFFIAIIHAARSSVIMSFFTHNDLINSVSKRSRFIEFFRSNRVSLALLKFKRTVTQQISGSMILSGRQELGTTLLRTPVRYYSVFLLSLGFTTVASYLINLYYLGHYFQIPVSQPYIGLLFFVLACAALPFNGTLAELIRSSTILKLILFGFFGVSIKLDDETPLKVSYSKIAVLGVGTCAISLFIPLYQIIIALALILCGIVILKSPETGVLLVIGTLFFLPLQYACVLIIAVWISFLFKFISGKRVLRYEYIDIFPLMITFILFFGGMVSLGAENLSSYLPAAFSTLYFLIAGLIRDPVWAGRCRVTFTIGGLVSSAWVLLRNLPGNPFNFSMNMLSASDRGGRADSLIENSGVLGLILAMLFFLQLANLYSRKNKAEKFGHFVLCVFFAITLFFVLESRAAILFIALALFAITVLAKGLRFIIPAAVAFIIVMPIFGLPTLTEMFTEASADILHRLTLWQDSLSMMTSYENRVALFGIGMRPDAPGQLFTGEQIDSSSGSLIVSLVLALGLPTVVLMGIVPLLICKYCLAHGQRCSDKNTPSRLHTYGGLLAMTYALLLGLTENVWYNYRCAAFFWLIVGFTVSVQRYSIGDTTQGYVSDHAIVPEI